MTPTPLGILAASLLVTACGDMKIISLLGNPASRTNGADASDGAANKPEPQCKTDGDCSAPTAHCDALTSKCVQCLANADCTTLVCNTVSHTCSGCLTNADCGGATPFCDDDDRKCAECTSASQCNRGEVCAFEAHRCAPACLTNSDCAGSGHPICAAASRVCVECTSDADCTAMNLEPHCDLRFGACVECLSDGDCTTGHCDTFENRCVECTDSSQCDGRVCDMFVCRG